MTEHQCPKLHWVSAGLSNAMPALIQGMATDDSPILHDGFRITLVADSGGVIARIRREDGAAFLVGRTMHVATATTPRATAEDAIVQAKLIIARALQRGC